MDQVPELSDQKIIKIQLNFLDAEKKQNDKSTLHDVQLRCLDELIYYKFKAKDPSVIQSLDTSIKTIEHMEINFVNTMKKMVLTKRQAHNNGLRQSLLAFKDQLPNPSKAHQQCLSLIDLIPENHPKIVPLMIHNQIDALLAVDLKSIKVISPDENKKHTHPALVGLGVGLATTLAVLSTGVLASTFSPVLSDMISGVDPAIMWTVLISSALLLGELHLQRRDLG